MIFHTLVSVLALFLVASPTWSAEDALPVNAQEIVATAFKNLYGFSSVQQVEIASGSVGGESFVRSAQVVRSGATIGPNRMLVRFSGPPDMRGVAIVLRERPNFQYDAFLYQPIFKRVRRVSLYQRTDAFFGTDLAFEDLEGKRSSQWKARLLRSEMKLGRKAWVIEMTPVDFPSGYEKIVGWFDQKLPVVVHFEFYLKGKGDERFKVVDVDPDAVVEKSGYFIPTHLKFTGDSGTRTVVRISEIDIRDSFPKHRFTPEALMRGTQRTDAANPKSH